jgi:hypothetical protein
MVGTSWPTARSVRADMPSRSASTSGPARRMPRSAASCATASSVMSSVETRMPPGGSSGRPGSPRLRAPERAPHRCRVGGWGGGELEHLGPAELVLPDGLHLAVHDPRKSKTAGTNSWWCWKMPPWPESG